MLCAAVQLQTTHIKTASASPPEVGRLTPETCRKFSDCERENVFSRLRYCDTALNFIY
jgi:hypothetical protein